MTDARQPEARHEPSAPDAVDGRLAIVTDHRHELLTRPALLDIAAGSVDLAWWRLAAIEPAT